MKKPFTIREKRLQKEAMFFDGTVESSKAIFYWASSIHPVDVEMVTPGDHHDISKYYLRVTHFDDVLIVKNGDWLILSKDQGVGFRVESDQVVQNNFDIFEDGDGVEDEIIDPEEHPGYLYITIGDLNEDGVTRDYRINVCSRMELAHYIMALESAKDALFRDNLTPKE